MIIKWLKKRRARKIRRAEIALGIMPSDLTVVDASGWRTPNRTLAGFSYFHGEWHTLEMGKTGVRDATPFEKVLATRLYIKYGRM